MDPIENALPISGQPRIGRPPMKRDTSGFILGKGRPAGAKNYSARSFLAQELRRLGFVWRTELIESYALYKQQMREYIAHPDTMAEPEPELLYFWMTLLPYLTLKVNEKETRRERPQHKRRQLISKAAIEQLARAEGRKI